MSTPVPIRDGLFAETDDGPVLLASECTTCGHTSFPASSLCLACGAQTQEPVDLGTEGELLSATVVHMGNGRFEPGYTVGYITMRAGIRVFGQLSSSAEGLPALGTRMRVELVPLWREPEHEVLGYRFAPAPGKDH